MLGPLLYFGGTILATLIVATLICHYRIAHQKQVSWGTVFASSAIANAVVLISLAFYEAGWHLFTRYAWSEPKGGWGGLIIVLGIITVICILPALGVAVYYQRRSKRNEKHVV